MPRKITQLKSAESTDVVNLHTLMRRVRTNTSRAPQVNARILAKAQSLRDELESCGYGVETGIDPEMVRSARAEDERAVAAAINGSSRPSSPVAVGGARAPTASARRRS